MQKIVEWCRDNELSCSLVSDNIVHIDDIKFLVIKQREDNILIDQEYDLLLSEEEAEQLDLVNYIAFEFGNNWYYSPKDETQLIPLKWVGKRKSIQNEIFPFLGIHSKYEIGAGTGEFDNWIAKAKFLNYTHLAICDEATMGGMFAFQKSCKKHQLTYTLGASYMVEFDNHIAPFKVYIQNYEGWRNCLLINKAVNVDSEHHKIALEQLLQLNKGLSFVLTNDALKALISRPIWLNKVSKLKDVYFQIDFTQFDSEQYDISCLNTIKQYLDKELFNKIPPVLISDAYYIDKQDFIAKNIIENAAPSRKKNQSKNHYFKHLDHIIEEAVPLFKENDDRFDFIISQGIANAQKIASSQFEIPTGVMRLPEYEMTDQEALEHNTNEDLFLSLISNAIKNIQPEKQKQYLERAEKEIEVIKMGGFIDYFLILYDLVNWSDKQGIERGFARGSAAGSLVSYLLKITLIDPIEYDLIFERFLNEARILKEVLQPDGTIKKVAGSPPDIDSDFESERRHEVKRYLFDRYGHDSVCYVGAYNILKIKSALKECANYFNIPFKEVNYVSSFYVNAGKKEAKSMNDFFKVAVETLQVKKFCNTYPDVINSMPLIHNSIKARSIHAAAVIVTPKSMDNQSMQIYDWFPVRKVDGVLISEFDGYELDELGFLKNDILGISQADKIKYCIALIKGTDGIDIDKTKISLDDEMVYEFFRQGMTQDIFQFNGGGMTNYLQRMSPGNIEDLIAANALYRPGSMTSGLHERYAKVKNGLEEPKYYWGIKGITEKTYGTMPYQEQILEIVRTVADFSLSEADILRRAIGKKDHQKISSFKDQFLSRAVSKGCPEGEAHEIWQIIEDNSDYSFNRSHSAAYTLLGYVGMWLKVHYPVHFYSTALQFADDKVRPLIIAEINTHCDIRIMPPDINRSDIKYTADYEKKELYWSLASIKHVGDKAIEIILKERQEGGNFFSLAEFLERCKKGAVNKRVIENLILTGSFDSIFCKSVIDRKGLIFELYGYLGLSVPDHYLDPKANVEVFWHKSCKVLGGFAKINFSQAVSRLKIKIPKKSLISNPSLLDAVKIDEPVLFGGFVEKIKKINSKKGVMAKINIELNGNIFKLVIWPNDYENLSIAEGDLVIGVSVLKFDSFEGFNCLYSGRSFDLIKI